MEIFYLDVHEGWRETQNFIRIYLFLSILSLFLSISNIQFLIQGFQNFFPPTQGYISVPGVYLGFFKWGALPPPTACHKVGVSGGGNGTPKPKVGGALFKKVQKWGGTFSSASPLPPTAWTEIYPWLYIIL